METLCNVIGLLHYKCVCSCFIVFGSLTYYEWWSYNYDLRLSMYRTIYTPLEFIFSYISVYFFPFRCQCFLSQCSSSSLSIYVCWRECKLLGGFNFPLVRWYLFSCICSTVFTTSVAMRENALEITIIWQQIQRIMTKTQKFPQWNH